MMTAIRIGRTTRVMSAGIAIVAFYVGNADGQIALGVYGGAAKTTKNTVRLTQPGGTGLTFENVEWKDESFEGPVYYGIRLTYWFDRRSKWGVAIDFTHAKLFAETNAVVFVYGRRGGARVKGTEPLGDTFQALAFSHGHNLLTLNLVRRWLLGNEEDDGLLSRLRPYLGAGIGVAVPNVETIIDDVVTDEYQLAGPAVEALGGAEIVIIRRLGFFAEYKLSYADMEGSLTGGGSINVEPWTHHFVLGVSLTLWLANPD